MLKIEVIFPFLFPEKLTNLLCLCGLKSIVISVFIRKELFKGRVSRSLRYSEGYVQFSPVPILRTPYSALGAPASRTPHPGEVFMSSGHGPLHHKTPSSPRAI